MYEETQPLLDQRIVLVVGSINEELYREVSWCLHLLRRNNDCDPIILRITSHGGATDLGFALADLVQIDGNVWGVGLGKVASAAATIFLACKRRYVSHHTVLGLHQTNFAGRDVTTATDLELMAIELKRRNHQTAMLLHNASLQSEQYWLNALTAAPAELVTYDHDDMCRMGIAFHYGLMAGDLENKK